MYAWLYKDSPLIAYPLVALLLFFAVFLVVLLRTYGRGTRREQEEAASLPLFDAETHTVNVNHDPVPGASHVQ